MDGNTDVYHIYWTNTVSMTSHSSSVSSHQYCGGKLRYTFLNIQAFHHAQVFPTVKISASQWSIAQWLMTIRIHRYDGFTTFHCINENCYCYFPW
ncbi:uncharacterized protein LOC124545030 isoform X2 [Schistocerca americana]|uniref:uncharacterized protein LOC124545030 isoform X2 n=1 Tax=Schistocerca americana TaxID=7009 RepID=UPI001F5012B9|nr:uncharacterized protein LOC124545030 isoform X2 [Schistocerca americana]